MRRSPRTCSPVTEDVEVAADSVELAADSVLEVADSVELVPAFVELVADYVMEVRLRRVTTVVVNFIDAAAVVFQRRQGCGVVVIYNMFLPIEKQGSKNPRKQESKEARKEANLPMSSSRGSLRSSTGTFRSKAICAGVLFVLQSGRAYKYTDPIIVQAENKERRQKLPAKTRA